MLEIQQWVCHECGSMASNQVDMSSGDVRRVEQSHDARDVGAPVAALGNVV